MLLKFQNDNLKKIEGAALIEAAHGLPNDSVRHAPLSSQNDTLAWNFKVLKFPRSTCSNC